MMYPKWKFGAGVALLALGVWLVPAALSSFTANTSFTTSEPVGGGAAVSDGFVVSSAAFESVGDEESLGSTDLGNYRLSMDGTIQSVGGLGESVRSYSGDYSLNYEEEVVSAGTFDLEATTALDGNSVLLNALLNEDIGAGEGFDGLASDDGSLALSGLSADGSSFAAALQGGPGISSDPAGGNGGLGDLDCADLLNGLCGCEECSHNGEEHNSNGDSSNPTVVPEPTSFAVLGMLGFAAMARRGRTGRR